MILLPNFFFFFFNDTATTEIYTLSLHDALPIYGMMNQHSGYKIGGKFSRNFVGNTEHVIFITVSKRHFQKVLSDECQHDTSRGVNTARIIENIKNQSQCKTQNQE